MRTLLEVVLIAALLSCGGTRAPGIGSRVFVVERASGSLAVYHLDQ